MITKKEIKKKKMPVFSLKINAKFRASKKNY